MFKNNSPDKSFKKQKGLYDVFCLWEVLLSNFHIWKIFYLEDIRDGNEVSGSVKHHSSVGKMWRVLDLKEAHKWFFATWTWIDLQIILPPGHELKIIKGIIFQPGLLLEGWMRKTRDPKRQVGTESQLRVWIKGMMVWMSLNKLTSSYLAPKYVSATMFTTRLPPSSLTPSV